RWAAGTGWRVGPAPSIGDDGDQDDRWPRDDGRIVQTLHRNHATWRWVGCGASAVADTARLAQRLGGGGQDQRRRARIPDQFARADADAHGLIADIDHQHLTTPIHGDSGGARRDGPPFVAVPALHARAIPAQV